MYDLLMTSSVAVFEAATLIKSMYMKKSWLKTRKTETIWKSNFFYINLHPKRWFTNLIHSLLRRANARDGVNIIYRMWRISLLCMSGTGRLISCFMSM